MTEKIEITVRPSYVTARTGRVTATVSRSCLEPALCIDCTSISVESAGAAVVSVSLRSVLEAADAAGRAAERLKGTSASGDAHALAQLVLSALGRSGARVSREGDTVIVGAVDEPAPLRFGTLSVLRGGDGTEH